MLSNLEKKSKSLVGCKTYHEILIQQKKMEMTNTLARYNRTQVQIPLDSTLLINSTTGGYGYIEKLQMYF